MPATRRIADRVDFRAPAVVGLMIATLGTYLLRIITIGTTRERIVWYLTVYFIGYRTAKLSAISFRRPSLAIGSKNRRPDPYRIDR